MIDNCLQKTEDISIRKMSPADSSSNRNSRTEEKYGLRPRTIIKRLQQERTRQEVPKKTVRSKSRPAPLSKYRRKTANARERHRMKEINNAFDSLRKVLPDAVEIPTTQSTMTKIMTLKLAVNYIRTLSDVLKSEESGVDFCSIQSSLQNSIEDSLQSCLDQSFQYSIHQSLQKTTHIGGNLLGYEHTHPHYLPNLISQNQQMMDYTSFSSSLSALSSPSTNRGSLSSASDLEELLSDDSALLEDTIDVFHDLPTLCASDALELLLGSDKEGISFPHELCS
ncbi:class A basic helix-loop-helix protein 15-like [Palaemon carinicauda]|uniref:class A basic helix-loop-helix protein 15-like n=1 Tax=Palaemon carinicauda TaxID=392227 RepID=UPI0035B6217C